MSPIGIVIVTYFSEREIGPCLDAALASGAQVIVVDNGSTDGTVREAAQRSGARLIANKSNRGFAAAANQGIQALETPYVLLLNPDAILVEGLESMRAACDLPDAGGAGGKLVGIDGKMQIGFMARALPTPAALILEALLLNRLWRGNLINRRYRGFRLDYSKVCPVGQPAGAFFMFRRCLWEKLGGFDEGFRPLWFEDVDFCRRAANEGYVLYFVPSAVARHQGGYSMSKISVEMRRVYWYSNLIRYASKHFRPAAGRAVCLAVLTGSFVRGCSEVVLNRSLRPLAAFWKIAKLAGRCAVFGWRDEVVLEDQ